MKKKNMVIIGVIALILVVAVGYAIFSDTLTINGSATAKGDFNLSYACELVDENINIADGVIAEGSTGTGSCSVEDGKVTTTSEFSKPTDLTTFMVTVTNNGSIPAVLKTVDSSNNFAQNMTDEGDVFYIDKTNALVAYYLITKNDVYQEVYGDSATAGANITLEPGENLKIYLAEGWMDSEDLQLESQPALSGGQATMQYNMILGFQQAS